MEGPGISVSEHPEAWTRIARRGGYGRYALTRRDERPGVFADMMRGRWRAAYEHQALRAGLLAEIVQFELSWWDDEIEERRALLFDTEAEAEYEAEDYVELDGKVTRILTYSATDKLIDLHWSHRFTGELDTTLAADMAVLYLLQQSGKYDGAWWDEAYDPEGLSAPRGVIFENKIREWRLGEGEECPGYKGEDEW